MSSNVSFFSFNKSDMQKVQTRKVNGQNQTIAQKDGKTYVEVQPGIWQEAHRYRKGNMFHKSEYETVKPQQQEGAQKPQGDMSDILEQIRTGELKVSNIGTDGDFTTILCENGDRITYNNKESLMVQRTTTDDNGVTRDEHFTIKDGKSIPTMTFFEEDGLANTIKYDENGQFLEATRKGTRTTDNIAVDQELDEKGRVIVDKSTLIQDEHGQDINSGGGRVEIGYYGETNVVGMKTYIDENGRTTKIVHYLPENVGNGIKDIVTPQYDQDGNLTGYEKVVYDYSTDEVSQHTEHLDAEGNEISDTPEQDVLPTKEHRVVSGETLTAIAKKEGISYQALLDANPEFKPGGGRNPNRIFAGRDVIKIPQKVNNQDQLNEDIATPASNPEPEPQPTALNTRAQAEADLTKEMSDQLNIQLDELYRPENAQKVNEFLLNKLIDPSFEPPQTGVVKLDSVTYQKASLITQAVNDKVDPNDINAYNQWLLNQYLDQQYKTT